jgi:membrane fusion protein (multidrug efflux system)
LKVRLARTEVRAPFEGIVESRTLSAGDYVNTQAILTTVNDLSRLKVEFQVPERYLSKVRARDANSPSGRRPWTRRPRIAEGEVYFVNSVIDRKTRSSAVKGFVSRPAKGLKAGHVCGGRGGARNAARERWRCRKVPSSSSSEGRS